MDYWQTFEYDGYFHIYNKAVSGITIFKDNDDYETFLTRLTKYLSNYLDVYAYVLMPNHFHLLIRVKNDGNILFLAEKEKTKSSIQLINNEIHINEFIVDQFKRFLSSYSISYKNKYKHSGSIFMERFKRIQSINLERNLYWLAYIHHNPIHHQYGKNYTDWLFSSYNAYISDKNTKIAKDEVLSEWFFSMSQFLEYHQEFKIDKGSVIDSIVD